MDSEKEILLEFFNHVQLLIYLFIYLSIYLFMAALGLHCCTQAFSSFGEQGLLFIAVASLVAGHGLWEHRLQ